MSWPLRLLIAAALAALGLAPLSASAATTPTTPIEHFVVLMQENHSFDNYFGTYPGADGHPKDACQPVSGARPKGRCVEPFRIGSRAITDLSHNVDTFKAQYNGGRMNGFVSAFEGLGPNKRLAMGYYDGRDIPYYWNLADDYVLFDRFFTSAAGGSVWNHMFWISGTPGNPEVDGIPEDGFGDLPTIFDRLEAAGVSWKFYVQNYDPEVTYRNRGTGDKSAQVVWNPLLAYDRYLDDPKLFGKIVDLEEYYTDLQRGTLPAVSYIVPSGASEHPPGSVQAGERFVRTLINSLARSTAWSSSAFMWTYDDWGGWYDHVRPPQVDRFGYGFRAPALLVSPYARRGHVDSTTLDFTSMLKFIEENWGLAPLARRDAQANNISSAFDFSQPPRLAEVVPATRRAELIEESGRGVVYLAYAFSILVATAIFALALHSARRPHGRRLALSAGHGAGRTIIVDRQGEANVSSNGGTRMRRLNGRGHR